MTEMNRMGTSTGSGQHLTTEHDAQPLIPVQVANQIIDGVVEGSAALSTFDRLPNMSSRVKRIPILDTLGSAAFTSSTTNDNVDDSGTDSQVTEEPSGHNEKPGLKDTHQMQWDNVYIVAETLAIILPVPDDVLADSEYDMWEAMRPRIIEAFHQKIDDAIIWGQNRPTNWPSGIVPTALARGNEIVDGTGADLGEDTSDVMGLLEEVAYDPTGWMAAPQMKARLRNLRDNQGGLIFNSSMQAGTPDQLWGLPIQYIRNNTFQYNHVRLICGKMNEAKFSIRQDLTFKLFKEGVVSDADGNVVLNLMQQDSQAMRVTMRLGWAVPNPIHKLRSTRATEYPFAVLTS